MGCVLFVRHAILLLSSNFAGAERVILELLRNSPPHRYCLLVNREIYSYYSDIGCACYDLGPLGVGSRLQMYSLQWKVARLLDKLVRRNEIDVISPVLELAYVPPVLMSTSIPLVPMLHGSEVKNLHPKRISIQNIAQRRIFAQADYLITVSSQLAADLPKTCFRKTYTIPNGVDTAVFRLLSDYERLHNVILFVGRYIPRKGIRELLRVASELDNYEFWFAGRGPLEEEIRQCVNCYDLGFQETEELVKLYNQATLAVFPSHWESWGLVGLESMACGCPIVVTEEGFSQYVTDGRNGVIVPSGDPERLRFTIERLMNDESSREQLSHSGLDMVRFYTWSTIAERYAQLLDSVADG
jgi:glycosyltransferase involved in cell wall biosynthesis